MSQLTPQNHAKLLEAVERLGVAAVARKLGVCRSSLTSVLVHRARPSTRDVIARAFLARAAELGAA